jgi:hypothetical protein
MLKRRLPNIEDEEPIDEKLVLRKVQEMTDAKINSSIKHFGDNLLDGVREYEDDNTVLNKIANDRLEAFGEFNNIGIFTNKDCLKSSMFIRDDSVRSVRDECGENIKCDVSAPSESSLDMLKRVNRDSRRELIDRLSKLILNENASFTVKFEGSYAGVSLNFEVSTSATKNLREE